MNDILDLHTHTIASGHAYSTLSEMIRAASAKGLTLYGCSDHAPTMPGSTHNFHFINFKVIPRNIHGVHVIMGSELNILDFDGNVDLPVSTLKRLDYTIASLHIPCLSPGTKEENTRAYVKVMENPYVTIIGHPDDSRFPIDYQVFAKAAKEHHKLVEVNNASLTPGSARAGARENYGILLNYCRDYQIPIVLSSDAHFETDVANHRYAWELLESLDFPEELIVNTSVEKLKPYIPVLNDMFGEPAGDSCCKGE